MIQLNNINLSFKDRVLFDSISVVFGKQKIGLVGRNGAGKSTLLSIIAGINKPDRGSISTQRETTIAYMPQEIVLESLKSVFDEAYDVFVHFTQLEEEYLQIEERLTTNPVNIQELLDRYQYIHEQLLHFDKSKSLARTKEILTGLGFSESMQQQSVAHLSTGWKMRLVLAKLLLQNADFYLFDEPTNHLDIVTKEWFCTFLKNFRGGFLLVSHDRYFLDTVCDHIFEIDRGNGHLFTGNFTQYVYQKDAERERTLAAYTQQQKDIARKQATIDRMRASATRAKQAQSMIKQLDRVERIEIEPSLPVISIRLKPVTRSGAIALTLVNIAYSFENKRLFTNVSGEIKRGQKVALVAANGVGKTTLFNIITGKYPKQTGSVTFGHNVSYAVFEQDQARVLAPDNTIFEEVSLHSSNVPESTIRAYLGAFLFSGDDIHKKIRVLSGGERNRVAMVKVFLQHANLLLLDEPTNHLDLYAKEILLQALQQYDGTLLFVSHDHDFISKLATTIWELTPTGIFVYDGPYEEYLWFKKQQQSSTPSSTPLSASASISVNKSVQKNNTSKQLRSIEQQIHRAEQDLSKESQKLGLHEYGTHEYRQVEKRIITLQETINRLQDEWEQLYSS